jgi:hypothetical protein
MVTPSAFFSGDLDLVQMAIRSSAGVKVLELTSGVNGEITINDDTADAWEFTVEERTITLTEGIYYYKIRLTDSNGVKVDWIAGSWQIKKDDF